MLRLVSLGAGSSVVLELGDRDSVAAWAAWAAEHGVGALYAVETPGGRRRRLDGHAAELAGWKSSNRGARRRSASSPKPEEDAISRGRPRAGVDAQSSRGTSR